MSKLNELKTHLESVLLDMSNAFVKAMTVQCIATPKCQMYKIIYSEPLTDSQLCESVISVEYCDNSSTQLQNEIVRI